MIGYPLTLLQLNNIVKQIIETRMLSEYWVSAELSQIGVRKGHCYMSLVQKSPFDNTPEARADAVCWRQTWSPLSDRFLQETGQKLCSGMTILLKVHAQMHPVYGFKWIVDDLDPSFTLGDMARKRAETIARLIEKGIFDLNKKVNMPLFTQQIAVISSPNAAGYEDFVRQLTDNIYGYTFKITLFEATMQGQQTASSIISALDKINNEMSSCCFDCVVIIRGGGATSDLIAFDDLELAEAVANFPLPIISGIGHQRDESVLDMVSHTRVKTPTAVATLLIERLKTIEDTLINYGSRIIKATTKATNLAEQHVARMEEKIKSRATLTTTKQKATLERMETLIKSHATSLITKEKFRIKNIEQCIESFDPEKLLKRGYSITTFNKKPLKSPLNLKTGDILTTRLHKGTIKSTVIK